MNTRALSRQALSPRQQMRIERKERFDRLKAASDARAAAVKKHTHAVDPYAPRSIAARQDDILQCSFNLSRSVNPLWRCHRRGCLVCADLDGARLRREVEERLTTLYEAHGGEYRMASLVLHCGDVPDNRPDLGRRRLRELQTAVTKLQRMSVGGAPAMLGGTHSFEVSPSQLLPQHAHPHLHALLLVRNDVHDGQLVNRLRRGAVTDVLIKPVVDYQDPAAGEIERITAAGKLCAYMVKVAKLEDTPTDAHCAFVDMVLARKRRYSRWGLLKPSALGVSEETAGEGGASVEHDDDDDDAEIDDSAPPQTRAAWRWSPFAQMYVPVNDGGSVDDYNERCVVSIVDEKGGGGDAG